MFLCILAKLSTHLFFRTYTVYSRLSLSFHFISFFARKFYLRSAPPLFLFVMALLQLPLSLSPALTYPMHCILWATDCNYFRGYTPVSAILIGNDSTTSRFHLFAHFLLTYIFLLILLHISHFKLLFFQFRLLSSFILLRKYAICDQL